MSCKLAEANSEHIKVLYQRIESIIDTIVEMKQSLDNIESNTKLLLWVKKQELDK